MCEITRKKTTPLDESRALTNLSAKNDNETILLFVLIEYFSSWIFSFIFDPNSDYFLQNCAADTMFSCIFSSMDFEV